MSLETWVEVRDPSPETLRSVLPDGLHETAWARLLAPLDESPRPRLEAHDHYVFGVFVVPVQQRRNGEVLEIVTEEIDVVVTPERLFAVHKSGSPDAWFDCGDARRVAVRAGQSVGMCLFALVDHIAEQFLDVVDEFDDEIDQLEDHVETWTSTQVRERIGRLRHDMLHVRRTLAPTRDAARHILDDRVDLDGAELFPRDVELHFADAYDKLLRGTDGLDLARDLLAGVRDYHQAKVANDQNDVMKKLTVIASMVLLPTFIVGLYGQNLKGSPEFGWAHGYAWSWGVIAVTTLMQFVYFRRRHWI
jgi:magnesium transporter